MPVLPQRGRGVDAIKQGKRSVGMMLFPAGCYSGLEHDSGPKGFATAAVVARLQQDTPP